MVLDNNEGEVETVTNDSCIQMRLILVACNVSFLQGDAKEQDQGHLSKE